MDGTRLLPPVLGDRIQLQQVILNLLVNAIEAVSEVDKRPRGPCHVGDGLAELGILVSYERCAAG
jgi:signal transduction histidine kinase